MRLSLVFLAALTAAACGAQDAPPPADRGADGSDAASLADPSADPIQVVETEAGPVGVYEVASGLAHPWGAALLPDGRMLVTERPGRLRIVGGEGGPPATVAGTPDVFARGQGGMLDVALAPDFAESGHVYLTYAKPGDGRSATTALGRGRLVEGADGPRLDGFEDLWEMRPYVVGPNHFGARIAFADGYVFVSTGERFQFSPAQDLGSTFGKVVRLHLDGSVPDDNPFVGQSGALPEIWSYGHRNAQSLAVDPETGTLWEAEFGPRGGDELNVVRPGANYGWPVVSWGDNYDGSEIPDPAGETEFTDAVRHWTPVISPSGMAFHTGEAFAEWNGDLLISSLTKQGIVRLTLDGEGVADEETIRLGARVREVEVGPDGRVYVLTDASDGAVWRLEPMDATP